MTDKSVNGSGIEKRGGYLAGPKTPKQVKPPPAAFGQPKSPAKASK